jgi:hypothetical protein
MTDALVWLIRRVRENRDKKEAYRNSDGEYFSSISEYLKNRDLKTIGIYRSKDCTVGRSMVG